MGTQGRILALKLYLIPIILSAACHHQPGLKQVFQEDFYIGVALNEDQIFGKDTQAVALVEKHFNSITAENVMKWEPLHPEPTRYHFEPADRFVAFGEKNKMFIVGHTLIWHYQTPGWVFQDKEGKPVDRQTLIQRMKDHIFTVVGRYKGRVHGWDVVNEALADDGSFRQSPWFTIIGSEYIEQAFQFARQADPEAELYYNDYNLWKPEKAAATVRLIQDLQSKGIRVDGVGEQGHWGLEYPENLQDLESSILAFSQLGLQVMITELDITVLPFPDPALIGADISRTFQWQKKLNPFPQVLPDSMQVVLAHRYAEVFRLFVKHRDKISRVTFWGVQDGQSFRNYWPISGRRDYPLLFDRQYQPKPAFYAVIKSKNLTPTNK
ncbi:MAG: endo-1,4-beta-xylanase [candidate division KSB1 bacterium]|nr:endo-1,4-beta-xylanase [candidate division KSB1 bacterium]